MHYKFIDAPSLFIRGLPCIKVFIGLQDKTQESRKNFVIRKDFKFLDIKLLITQIKERLDIKRGFVLDTRGILEVNELKFIIHAIGKYLWDARKYKTNAKERLERYERMLYIWGNKEHAHIAEKTLQAISCADIARDLASEPSNLMGGPIGFVERVKGLFKKHMRRVKIHIYTAEDLKSMGLNLILAMGQGSEKQPQMFVVDYTPTGHSKKDPVVAIAGKGVCFDSGGYNIKINSIYGMNTDKTGAAIAVSCIHHAVLHSDSNTRIIAVCPLIENRVSHNAILPGDVIKSVNGKTVEIVDTDAEGRVIIADALAHICQTYDPDIIVDVGTFTGSATRLHCGASFAYYTENDQIDSALTHISHLTFERGIRLPPWSEYIEFTKGNVADLKNITSECIGDANIAAMFLMNFVELKHRKNWLHIDVINYNNDATCLCNSSVTLMEFIHRIRRVNRESDMIK